jgi:histidinol dehydrogenase
LKAAIRQAYQNISSFHFAQWEQVQKVQTMPGVTCWRKSIPIGRVGLYIPGGTAPLFSTVLMLGIPAQLAGCQQVTLCTPAQKDGSVHPAILFAAQLCGIQQIFKVGGAQAIGAMAYGTETISKVWKIFGPGNPWVTTAKQLVSLDGIAIDLPAGPSEVCVVADASAHPEFVAADLLSQAEHGSDSQVMLISDNEALISAVERALEIQLKTLPRLDFAQKSLSNSMAILVNDLEEAMVWANAYAPEHLILAVEHPEHWADRVTDAGSVFLGHFTPESAGDYASGTNHTLPTSGYARAYSGVSLDSFLKKVTFQQISAEGLGALAPSIVAMANAEGLEAHANAVKIRLSN